MRMARVCQADGGAIAARRISEEKHEIVVPRSRRDRTCFLSPFFASPCPGYSRFSLCSPSSPAPLRPPPCNKIRFDVNLSTDISSQRGGIARTTLLSSFFPSFAFIVQGTLCMNFVYKVPITFFSSIVPANKTTVGIIDIVRACWK